MECVNDTKQWVVFDARAKQFIELSHEEFKRFINDRPPYSPIKFKDVRIWDKGKGKRVWIDAITNSECFK